MTYYKFLSKDGTSSCPKTHWSLPTKNSDGTWAPGAWMPKAEELAFFTSGYRVCSRESLVNWVNDELYEIEVQGKHIEADTMSCWQQSRLMRRVDTWNERTIRLFMCDCVEHVLYIFGSSQWATSGWPQQAIEVSRLYANGEMTKRDLCTMSNCAKCVASNITSVAAQRVTEAASWCASESSVWYAASQAREAAEASIWGTRQNGQTATKNAEYRWQNNRLWLYLKGDIA